MLGKMIERIRQKKRLQELLRADLKDLQAKGEYILSLCPDMHGDKSEHKDLEKSGLDPWLDPTNWVEHHLPLKDLVKGWLDPTNWDLTDEQIDIVNAYSEDLMHYASLVVSCYLFSSEKTQMPELILPLWLVFPTYSATTIGWRMGTGESYEICYNKTLKCMGYETRQAYMQRFPAPEYMKMRCNYWLYQKIM